MKYLKIISQLNVNDKNAIFIFMILPYRRENIIKPSPTPLTEEQSTFNKLQRADVFWLRVRFNFDEFS
jgi:hypothetical protein